MPEACGLCGGSDGRTTVSGRRLCQLCATTDPTEWLAARGQPTELRKATVRFTAGVHVPGVLEGFRLRCGPERRPHAVAKLLVDEVEVGGPIVDDAVFVRTSDGATAQHNLASEGMQSALLALLSGCRPEAIPNHVTLEAPTLTVTMSPMPMLDDASWLQHQLETASLAVR